MKARASSMFIFLGLFLVLILIALPQKAAHAQICGYDQNKQPIPCPPGEKEKRATKTPIPPSKTPIPTDTLVPTATYTKVAAVQQSVPISQDPSNPPCSNNANNGPLPDSGQASQGGNTLFPWLMGGGGLLSGILIGLIIAGGSRPSLNRGGMTPPDGTLPTPGELLPAVDMFHKDQDAGGIIGPVDGFEKWAKVNPRGTFDKLGNDNAGVWVKDDFIKGHDASKKASPAMDDWENPALTGAEKQDVGGDFFKYDNKANNFIKGQAEVNGDIPPGPPNNFIKGQSNVNGDGLTTEPPGPPNNFIKGQANVNGDGLTGHGSGGGEGIDTNLGDGSV